MRFASDGLKLILIDDHNNTFYPLINYSIEKVEINNKSNIIIKNNNNESNINLNNINDII